MEKANSSKLNYFIFCIFAITILGYSKNATLSTALVLLFCFLIIVTKCKININRLYSVGIAMLLFPFLLISCSYSTNTTNGFKTILVIFTGYLVFISIGALKWSYIDINKHLNIMIVLSLICLLIGYIFYFYPEIILKIGPLFLNQGHVMDTYGWNQNIRMTSTWVHPSLFGSFMYMAALVTLNKILNAKHKIFYLILLIFMFSGMFLTNTRTVIMAFGIGATYMIFSNFSFKKFIQLLSIICICVLMYMFISGHTDKLILINRMSKLDSIDSRFYLYRDAYHMFTDYPLFGRGLGSFLNRPIQYVTSTEVTNAHNIVLQSLSEIGLIGTVILILFAICAIINDVKRSRYLKKIKSNYYYIQILITSITLSILADSMVQNPLLSWRVVVFLAFFRGMSSIIKDKIKYGDELLLEDKNNKIIKRHKKLRIVWR